MPYSQTYLMFIVKMQRIIASFINSRGTLCEDSLQNEQNWRFLVPDTLEKLYAQEIHNSW